VYGGGVQSDGVFSNLTAKPEVGEKEEQPPVCCSTLLRSAVRCQIPAYGALTLKL